MSSSAISLTAARTLLLAFCHSEPPRRCSLTWASSLGPMYLETMSSWVTGTYRVSPLGVAHLDVVLGDALHIDLVDALENADAVGGMHHIVARRELGKAVNLLTVLPGVCASVWRRRPDVPA